MWYKYNHFLLKIHTYFYLENFKNAVYKTNSPWRQLDNTNIFIFVYTFMNIKVCSIEIKSNKEYISTISNQHASELLRTEIFFK